MIKLNKWDNRFLKLALEVSTWSKDNCKVGAILISPDKKQISYGYNGFPKEISDKKLKNKNKNKNKNDLIIHAEINAILNSKTDLINWVLYCTKFPCLNCAKAIIQSNIKKIVSKRRQNSSWLKSQNLAYDLLKQCKVIILEV